MDIKEFSAGVADAVERAAAGVVTVNGRKRQTASGIVWQADLVVTADHVVQRDDHLSIVTPDGVEHAAELVGRDGSSDIALLRVPGANLTPATFASIEPRVGQIVLAVGRPSEVQASLGIINAVGGPVRMRRGTLEQYLRTDATPYPGFSGGPLINVAGEVVGLFTSGLAGGEPVAIPAAVVAKVGENLRAHGRIRRGFLGISSQTIALPANQRAGRSQEHGLLLVNVEEGSPAAQAGLLVGDILVGLAGQQMGDPGDLQDLLRGDQVGQTVNAEVIRGNQLHTLAVTIGERK